MRAAAMCATRNMYKDLGPPIKALLVNSDVEKIYVLTEDPDPGVYLPPECEVIDVSGQRFFTRACPNWSNPWSWIVLMRAVYYRMFPELERILSIDLDAFALSDVSGLWRLDLTGKLLAGVRETSKLARPEFPYYNAGVMVQNLDLLRRSGAGDQIWRALRKRYFAYPEQDAFNLVCSGAVYDLPAEYNAGRGTEPYGEPVIRHFMGEQATFRDSEICRRFAAMPWDKVRPADEEKW